MRPKRPLNGRLTAALAYAVLILAMAFVVYVIWWI